MAENKPFKLSGKIIKVKCLEAYYDGIQRRKEGAIINIDEAQFNEETMVKVGGSSSAKAASKKPSMKKSQQVVEEEAVESEEPEMDPLDADDENNDVLE